MGGFFGGGVASSAAQGATSTARDPAVRSTGSRTGTQTRGSSPRPPARKPTQVERTVYNVTGNIARDLTMGLSTFGQSGERQAQTLRERGYSDDVIKEYQDRTAASQERMRQSMMSSNDDNDSRPLYQAAVQQKKANPTNAPPPHLTAPPAPPAGAEPEAGSAEEALWRAQTSVRASSTFRLAHRALTKAKTRRRRSSWR